LTAPKALFSNRSAILELRIFFKKKSPKIKTLFYDKNSKERERRKILPTIWGFYFLQSRGIEKKFMGVSKY